MPTRIEVNVITGETQILELTPEEIAEAAQMFADEQAMLASQPLTLEQKVAALTAALEAKNVLVNGDLSAAAANLKG